ncbi:MAG: PEP-CTERM sorting domain-containing protein [Planctomycetaceae bacterium]|nr:PEP-CTERM sorting domain-containing protein [Planctomycetaceae bacterium]
MKNTKLFSLALISGVMTLAMLGNAFADLNASQIVTNFNNANGTNSGIQFTFTNNNSESTFTNAGTNFAPLSAYTGAGTAGSNYFKSFCVEPGQTITQDGSIYTGRLDYNGTVTKNSSGYALTLGAAVLYKQFATGTLTGYTGSASAPQMLVAIAVLTGQQVLSNWNTNTFLAGLLQQNSNQNYWMGSYNPAMQYSEIGDYSVFVMQITKGATQYQDMIYVAKATGTVPEPATLLLWSLGGFSVAGMTWMKRRRSLALA